MHKRNAAFTPRTNPEGALYLLLFQHQPSPPEWRSGTVCGQRSVFAEARNERPLQHPFIHRAYVVPGQDEKSGIRLNLLSIAIRCTKEICWWSAVGNLSSQRAEQGSPGQPLIHVRGHFLNVRILRVLCLPRRKQHLYPQSRTLVFIHQDFRNKKYRSEQLSSEKKQQQNWNALAINEAIKSNLC